MRGVDAAEGGIVKLVVISFTNIPNPQLTMKMLPNSNITRPVAYLREH